MDAKSFQENSKKFDQSSSKYQYRNNTATEKDIRLLHHTLGVAGEAGELVDAVKKHFFYGQELDRENIIEEISDCFWYQSQLLSLLGVSIEECFQINFDKLSKRYAKGYSDQAAKERADKKMEEEDVFIRADD
jgi:NTP pyrophosphatase (non-canonical NTP hydrolase)